MLRSIFVVLGTLLLLSGTASAAKMTEKEKCLLGVTDVREAMDAGDTPEPGAKTRAEVESLLEVSTHLCEQGNFRYAEKLLELARGMVASE